MKNNKYYIIAITILVIIISIQRCGNSNKYEALKTELAKQKEIVEQTSIKRLREKDSLNFEIYQREKTNDSLKNNVVSLESKIKTIRDRVISIPKTTNEFSDYFNNRYGFNDNLVLDDKVGLGIKTATSVTIDLEIADNNALIIPLKDEQLKYKDSIIVNLESDKEDLSVQIFSAEKEILERIKLEELANKSIKTLERKSKWNKVYAIGGIIGGVLIGSQLSK